MAVNHTPRPHTTRAGTTHGPGDPWQNQAACAGQDPEAWATPTGVQSGQMANARAALAVCAVCPVLDQCREWAQRSVDNRRGLILGGIPFTEYGIEPHRCTFCGCYVINSGRAGKWCERHLGHRDAQYRANERAAAA